MRSRKGLLTYMIFIYGEFYYSFYHNEGLEN